jgi:hypothetical protein
MQRMETSCAAEDDDEDDGAVAVFFCFPVWLHCLLGCSFSLRMMLRCSPVFWVFLWVLLQFSPLVFGPKNPLSSSVSWLPPLPVHSPAFPSSVFLSCRPWLFSSPRFFLPLLFVRLLCFFLKKPEATSRPLLFFFLLSHSPVLGLLFS